VCLLAKKSCHKHWERRLWGKDGSAKQSSEIGRVDAATLAAVQKHKELQEGLTDEMVVLAAQLKDSSC
jgi:hypothetical protein